MNDEKLLDELNDSAMQIILRAGDARELITKSYDAIKQKDLDKYNELIEAAEAKLVEAHKAQTKIIQDQIALSINTYSILFAHAQDTLMCVNSELVTTKRIVTLFI